jgi:hypothetical protein
MYFQNAISFQHSCLKETLENAFSRFSQIGICKLELYESNSGPNIVYLKVRGNKKQELEKFYSILEAVSSCNNRDK